MQFRSNSALVHTGKQNPTSTTCLQAEEGHDTKGKCSGAKRTLRSSGINAVHPSNLALVPWLVWASCKSPVK